VAAHIYEGSLDCHVMKEVLLPLDQQTRPLRVEYKSSKKTPNAPVRIRLLLVVSIASIDLC
jgi:hypothetical protein